MDNRPDRRILIRMAAFGLPTNTPAFGYMRLCGLIAVLAGGILSMNDGDHSVSSTLIVVGLIVGVLGVGLSWQQRRALTFEQHLAEYVDGDRDDLPT